MPICNITTDSDHDYYRLFIYSTSPSGLRIDLTGQPMVMKLRHHVNDVTAALMLSTETGEIYIVDGPTGQFTIRITQDTLLRLAPGEYVHSLIRTMGDVKLEVWSGTLTHSVGPSR